MKKEDFITLFVVITAACTVANLIALSVAAKEAEKKLAGSSIGGLLK